MDKHGVAQEDCGERLWLALSRRALDICARCHKDKRNKFERPDLWFAQEPSTVVARIRVVQDRRGASDQMAGVTFPMVQIRMKAWSLQDQAQSGQRNWFVDEYGTPICRLLAPPCDGNAEMWHRNQVPSNVAKDEVLECESALAEGCQIRDICIDYFQINTYFVNFNLS